MQNKINIPIAVIYRLPRYYRYLESLLDDGITRVSSSELSEKMGLTASQIRQDFNNFGCFGQQGYGYNVESLYNEIKKILGLEKLYNLIIIGAGNIGQALASYAKFELRGFKITAMFDVNPKLIGLTIRGIEILDMDMLTDYVAKNPVDIAVLALPGAQAEKAAERVLACGIKGIWNFSHVDLNTPEDVTVENVHLTDSLMTLSYRLREK